MKKIKRIKTETYIAFSCLLFIFACNSSPNNVNETENEKQADTLTYTMETYRIESDLAKKPGDTIKEKTYFEASYPKFQDTSVNSFVQSMVVMNNNPDIHYNTLEEAGKGFIQGYEDYQKLDYSSPWPWYNNIHAQVLKNTPAYLSVAVDYDDFMGGAHGNHGTNFGNFDLSTQKELTLNDIIQADKMDSLTRAGEAIFIKQEMIDPQDSLKGYFFENDTFALNENFLLQDSSILFLYNVYEIKPYASGITKLEIPYSEIKSLLTPKAKEILKIN